MYCVNIDHHPSQCFALIEQSESLNPSSELEGAEGGFVQGTCNAPYRGSPTHSSDWIWARRWSIIHKNFEGFSISNEKNVTRIKKQCRSFPEKPYLSEVDINNCSVIDNYVPATGKLLDVEIVDRSSILTILMNKKLMKVKLKHKRKMS